MPPGREFQCNHRLTKTVALADYLLASLTFRGFRARAKKAVQDSRASTACVRKNRKEVLPMVKHVFSRFVPAALVFVGWLAFVAGILTSDPVPKISVRTTES